MHYLRHAATSRLVSCEMLGKKGTKMERRKGGRAEGWKGGKGRGREASVAVIARRYCVE